MTSLHRSPCSRNRRVEGCAFRFIEVVAFVVDDEVKHRTLWKGCGRIHLKATIEYPRAYRRHVSTVAQSRVGFSDLWLAARGMAAMQRTEGSAPNRED